MNDFYRHKKNDKVKWVFTGVAFFLVFVMLTGVCLQLFGQGNMKPSEWFKKNDTICEHIDEDNDGKCDECGEDMPKENSDDNIEVSIPDKDNGISLTKTMLTAAQYDEYGISTQADSAFVINAVAYLPDGTSPDVYQSFDWSMSWATTNSKTVTDYVKMTVNGSQASFECLKAFDTKITLTVTSTIASSVKQTATFNYCKRPVSCKVENLYSTESGKQEFQTVKDGSVIDGYFGTYNKENYELEWLHIPTLDSFVFGTGTLTDSIVSSSFSVTLSLSSEFRSYFSRTHSQFAFTYKDITLSAGDTIGSIDTLWEKLINYNYDPATVEYYFVTALSEITNQFEMKISFGTTSDRVYNWTFYLNAHVTPQTVSNIKLNGGNSSLSHTF